MNALDVLRQTQATSMMVVDSYLSDLSDADLLRRPAPGCNHLAWQLGHLIAAESDLLNMVRPGSGPAMPEGFAAAHCKDAASSDDASKFRTKDEYLTLWKSVQEATGKLIGQLTEGDLDAPGPENWRAMFPTMGAIMVLIATHPMMHAGQWVPLRRALGKPVRI